MDQRDLGVPRAAAAGQAGGRRVALYSHDTMGIGHVRRNMLLAHALAAPPVSATVLLLAGAREAGSFAVPPGVDFLTLPALYKTAEGQYRPRALGVSLRELGELRGRVIAAALAAFAPDVFIVDKEPRGAVGELQPALEELAAAGRTRCVLGLRDVLDDPATIRREWRAGGNEEAICRHYDAVWVYGDPAVYDPVREYDLSPEVAARVAYTGYLHPDIRGASESLPDALPSRFVLCSVGGGQDGSRVAEAFAAAARPPGTDGVIVTGPFMPREVRERLRRAARGGLHVLELVPDLTPLLRRAERVVAMGGYNTVCEVLAVGRPALIVPRVQPRREQLIRAERLRDRGLLDVLHPDDISPQALSRWLGGDLAPRPPATDRLDMNGTARVPRLLEDVLGRRGVAPTEASPARRPHHPGTHRRSTPCHPLDRRASATW